MLYSDYNRRMKKVAAVLSRVRKFKIPIIILCFLIVAIAVTLLSTRGLVYDSASCPAEIVYGESFTYKASAFLGDVEYEFRAEGSDKWIKQQPIRAGKYYVRAVSKRIFGSESYGKVHVFTILPKTTDITVAANAVYGEAPEFSAQLVYGDTITVDKFEYADLSKNVTAVNAVMSSVKISDDNGEDVTSSYALNCVKSQITFAPREVEITVADAKIEYNGKPLTSSEWAVTSGELAEGDSLVSVFDKSQTEVGSVENTVSHVVVNAYGVNVTANYKIKQVAGKLTVEKRTVVIDTEGGTHEYDGTPFTVSEYKVSDKTPLVDGDRLELQSNTSLIDAGTAENLMVFKVYNSSGEDVSDNYSLVVNAGTLEVARREITVKTEGDTREYNGSALFNTEYEIIGAQLAAGHSLRIENYPEITDAGSVSNSIDFVVLADDGTAVSANYKIMVECGTLTVTPIKVTVTTDGKTWTYNGTAYKETGFSYSGMLDGHSLKAIRYTEITNVAYDVDGNVTDVDNVIEFEVVGTKSCNYEIVATCGKLKVTPRTVRIQTAADNDIVYDGKEHSNTAYEFKNQNEDEGLVLDHKLKATEYTKATDVRLDDGGEVIAYDNIVVYAVVDGNGGFYSDDCLISDNYIIIIVSYGTITINKRPITFTAGDCEKEYDGEPLSNTDNDNYAVNTGDKVGFAQGHTADVIFTGSITDAGEQKINVIESVVIYALADSEKTSLNSNYDITLEDGTLKVTPREVTVSTGTKSWVYDGKPHSYYEEGSFVADRMLTDKGHSLKVVEYTEITDVVYDKPKVNPETSEPNKNRNVIGIDNVLVFEVVGTLSSNYDIKVTELGMLTVTTRPLTINTHSNEWVYDGEYHSERNYDISDDTPIADGQSVHAYGWASIRQVLYSSKANDVIGYLNKAYFYIYDNNSKSYVEDNYEIKFIYGEIKITPRPIIIETPTEAYEYDGTEKRTGYPIVAADSPYGLANGNYGADTIVPTTEDYVVLPKENDIYTSRTDVGSSENIITFRIRNDFDNVTSCYKITLINGTLTVSEREITVRAKSATTVYNGRPISCKEFEVIKGSLAEKQYGEATYNDEYVNAGEYSCAITAFEVFDRLNNNVTHNYKINIDGTAAKFVISKRPIVLESYGTKDDDRYYNSDYWYYDGTGKSFPQFGVKAAFYESGELIPKHIIWDDAGSWAVVVDAGAYINTFTAGIFDFSGVDVTDNYDIIYEYGTLTVLPRPITVETASNEWEYRKGDKHFDDTFEITEGSLVSEDNAVVGRYPTIEEIGEIFNNLELKIYRGDSDDVTGNYLITYHYGTLKVFYKSASALKIYSEKDTTVYLRQMSYGAYTGKVSQTGEPDKTWAAGVEYGYTLDYNGNNYSYNYLPSIVMQNSGIAVNSIEIELFNNTCYSLPYYLTLNENNRQTSDVEYSGSGVTKYSAYHYIYDYSSDKGAAIDTSKLGIYANAEREYREFAYNNYTDVPDSTAAYMNGIITAMKFDLLTVPEQISAVAKYIQTAAEYNLNYNRAINDEDDVAVAFLDKYKEGVCVHYATAATVMLRTLGIPARYTVGFMANAQAGKWVEVRDGHAWVEAYIDGFGWVNVEVTGSAGSGGSGGGEGGSGEGDGDGNGDTNINRQTLEIKPIDVNKEYDGTPLYAQKIVEDYNGGIALATLLASGYYYEAEVKGSRVDYGKSESIIVSFRLFAPSGKDVTDKFEIKYYPGIIWITKIQILISIPYISKVYDGTPIVFEELIEGVYGYSWETLPENVSNVVIDMGEYKGFTNAGELTALQLASAFEELGLCHVYDSSGNEVSQNYTVIFKDGGLKIIARSITITAESAEKTFDGTPLTCNGYSLSGDGLLEGHTIEVIIVGSIVDVGEIQNTVYIVRIFDKNGNLVTDGYAINFSHGKLTVK